MRIIVDTCVWYELGRNPDLYEKVKDEPLVPTILSLVEVGHTANLFDEQRSETEQAIIKMMKWSNDMMYNTPFHFIANLPEPEMKGLDLLLKFTALVANGAAIPEEQMGVLRNVRDKVLKPKTNWALTTNSMAAQTNTPETKRKIKKNNTLPLTWELILTYIKDQTGHDDVNDLDPNQCELLVRVWDQFIRLQQVQYVVAEENDLYDILNMSYVRPGDKYWTIEKRWLHRAKEAGCSGYLYKPPT